MNNIFLIAKREYLEKIRGRAFKISTVLVPVLAIALQGVGYLTHRTAKSGDRVAIAAQDPVLAAEVRRQILDDMDAKSTVDVVAPATRQDRDVLLKLVQTKAIDGVLVIDTSSAGDTTATYTSQSPGPFTNYTRMKSALNRALANERMIARGMKPSDADAVLQSVSIETVQVDRAGKTLKNTGMAPFNKSIILAFLLTMPIILYGMDMARSIIEEKSSRIFEVMMAVTRPEEMLAGKLIGVGGAGLTQIAIWVVAVGILTGSVLAASMVTGSLAIHFSWVEGVLFPVYFVLGFLFYSSFFSGLAATCETAQDLQMYTPLIILPVWISLGVLPYLLNHPGSVWSVAITLFPFTSPFVMIPRMGIETVPLWQLAASIVLLALSIWAALWFSSRLCRVGVLMYGKRATLPEIVRWLRYS